MCRLFTLRANQPTVIRGSLLEGPQALLQQSCCDSRGQAHDDGWGIGYYRDGQAFRVRSALPARNDPEYRALAETVGAPTILAHVRQASAGGAEVRDSHPFVHGRWMFMHNGTLYGFAEAPERLRNLIPGHLRSCIEGTTDSEHVFYYLLARLEKAGLALDGPADAEGTARALRETIHTLVDLFPRGDEGDSQCNFVLCDGRLLLASRWGRSLFWLERRGAERGGLDGPVEGGRDYHALAAASEPTTAEAWAEVPEKNLLCIDGELRQSLTSLA